MENVQHIVFYIVEILTAFRLFFQTQGSVKPRLSTLGIRPRELLRRYATLIGYNGDRLVEQLRAASTGEV